MIILPAIDIRGGRCVRLVKGDFSTASQVAENALETAKGFEADGAAWLHMVDLDGAVEGKRVNAGVFTEIAANTGLRTELGGGIRDRETVEYYLGRGISRVIIGSAALTDPELVRGAARDWGERIAVGIDAKNRKAATRGWLDESEVDFIELAKRMEDAGVKTLIFTDISRDGTLSGPPVALLEELSKAVSCGVIASGGIGGIEDIRALLPLGLAGAICGKAIYAGKLSLREAIGLAGDQHAG